MSAVNAKPDPFIHDRTGICFYVQILLVYTVMWIVQTPGQATGNEAAVSSGEVSLRVEGVDGLSRPGRLEVFVAREKVGFYVIKWVGPPVPDHGRVILPAVLQAQLVGSVGILGRCCG